MADSDERSGCPGSGGHILRIFVILSVLLAASLPLSAAGYPIPGDGPNDTGEISYFFDRIVPVQMEQYHIPGAVIAVVREDEVLFAGGWGYADLNEGEEMDPAGTLVRTGSISKIIVWTAVMQCVEKGEIMLDADINTYLPPPGIPDTFPGKPVTMRHLMTHTAGFEEKATGIFARDAADLSALDAIVSGYMPARVRPPGRLPAYSNHGAALAGYAVEQVSGQPFTVYAEENILIPLGMLNSTFLQPPPQEMAGRTARGYSSSRGRLQEEEFEYVQLVPAGAMSATATDMGRFMICHLGGGRYENSSILAESSVREMHGQMFSPDSRIAGWAGGFMERYRNGRRILWHGGDTMYTSSIIAILPEERVGLFAAYNSAGGSMAGIPLLQAFMDHYYPPPPDTGITTEFPCPTGAEFTGTYVSTRSSATTYEKILLLSPGSGMTISVTESPEGGIRIGDRTLCESEPMVFCDGRGNIAAFFRKAENGPVCLFLSNRPDIAYCRLAWHETPLFHLSVAVACQGIFFSMLLLWSAAVLFPSFLIPSRTFRRAHLVFAAVCGICILFIVMLLGVLQSATILYGVPLQLLFILLLPPAAAVLVFVAAGITFLFWMEKRGTVRDRLEFTLITVSTGIFLYWTVYWNVMGWQF